MQMKSSYMLWVISFCIWMIVRCIPLTSFHGLYGFDPWYHLSVILGIQSTNRIPEVSPFFTRYYDHPGMHLFNILIHELTGLPMIVCLQVFSILAAAITFITFYVFFRYLLEIDWLAMVCAIILALSPDFLAQTNSAIPEFFALIFLPLGWFIILKIIGNARKRINLGVVLIIITFIIYLIHNWVSLIFALGCIAIFAGVLIQRPSNTLSSVVAILFPASLSVILLIFFDPWSAALFTRNALLITAIGFFIIVTFSILAIFGFKILNRIYSIRKRLQPRYFIVAGLIIIITFFLTVLLFYPVSRSVFWIIWRFSPFAFFIGLAVMALNFIPNRNSPRILNELFMVSWVIFLGLLFMGGYILTLGDVSQWHQLTIEATLTHRILIYLVIALAPLACLSIFLFLQSNFQKESRSGLSWKKGVILGIVMLTSLSLIISSYNVYFPIGGWHQNWYHQTEIRGAFWLSEVRGPSSITYVDTRIEWLITGTIPKIPSNHTTEVINLSSFNPSTVFIENGLNNYYFITDILEAEFMVDYATPPILVNFRTSLNKNPLLVRCYSNFLVTVYQQ